MIYLLPVLFWLHYEEDIMKSKIFISENNIDQHLSSISAKISDASELYNKALETIHHSQNLLITAQKEIDSLYISIENPE